MFRFGVRARASLALSAPLAVLVVMLFAGGASASDKGWCSDGGWTTLRTASGDSFKNQGLCFAYVAHGGKLFLAAPMTVTGPNPSANPTVRLVVELPPVKFGSTELKYVDEAVQLALDDRGSGGSPTCSAVLVAGKGSCEVTVSAPGTFTVTATFAGDTKSDPGLLPSTAQTSIIVLPCTAGC